ncbi:putative zinc finger protein [Orchesella cincta]|uniref:Putative zinc finger protein n=1 Tax=Orchesella cincta TaxID=48709 RepID=A0A1D2N836_ORCCI|nr:putative zinc finger protein [Orchesella cincta]
MATSAYKGPDELQATKTYKNANRITYYEDETTGKKYYKCPICGKFLKGHLTIHMRIHFDDNKPSWPCTVCGKNVRLQQKLRGHTGEKPYQCEQCLHRFAQSDQLTEHRRMHTGEPLINVILASASLRHYQKHNGERSYFCKLCDASFRSKGDLSSHDRNVHRKRMVACVFCEKSYKQRDLYRHLLTHTREKPYFCKEKGCDKEFALERNLKEHYYEHTVSKFPFACEACPGRFSKKTELARHVKAVHDEKYEESYRHACDQCPRRYKKKSDLNYHKQQVHPVDGDDLDSNKKHQCSECPKKFLRKTDLNIHMTSHSKEQNFECDECGTKYKHMKSLKRHQALSHAPVTEQSFQCECQICGDQFPKKSSLNAHLNTVHTGTNN